MNIPNSFSLFGQKIEVIIEDDIAVEDNAWGLTLYNKNIIKLSSKCRPDSLIEETFYHELIHIILHVMGEHDLKKNEKLINSFASLLYQAIVTSEYIL